MTNFCKIGFSSIFFFFSNRAYNIEHFSILERLFWPIINCDFAPPPPIFFRKFEKSKKHRGFANFQYKIRPFYAMFRVKNTLVNQSIFSFFEREFGRLFDILPHYTDDFFSSIFIVPTKNRISSLKVPKN